MADIGSIASGVLAGLLDRDGGARRRYGVPGQPSKAWNPMATGPAGNVIVRKDVHPKKA